MTRTATQELSWKSINANGMLPKRRLKVYNALFEHGPCTAGQLTRFVQKKDNMLLGNPSDHKRLAELEGQGVVCRLNTYTTAPGISERVSAMTGLLEWLDPLTDEWSNVWDVTDRLPSKPALTPKALKPTKTELKDAHTALLDLYYLLDPQYYREHNGGRVPPPIVADAAKAATIRKLGMWIRKLSQ
jgi:hypothetical protein